MTTLDPRVVGFCMSVDLFPIGHFSDMLKPSAGNKSLILNILFVIAIAWKDIDVVGEYLK